MRCSHTVASHLHPQTVAECYKLQTTWLLVLIAPIPDNTIVSVKLTCSQPHQYLALVVGLPVSMSVPAFPGTSHTLPAELLVSDTHNALSRHILPPYYPTCTATKLQRKVHKATDSKPEPDERDLRRSPRIATRPQTPTTDSPSLPSSGESSLTKSESRRPTATTHKLFELYGSFE